MGLEKTFNRIYDLLTATNSKPFSLTLASLRENYMRSFQNQNPRV